MIKLFMSLGLILSSTLLLSCANNTQFSLPNGTTDTTPSIVQRSNDESKELVLEPVTLWDEHQISDVVTLSVDERNFTSRVRQQKFMEHSYAKIGLYWNSSQNNIYVPIVVLSKNPIKIYGLEIRTDNNKASLTKARLFDFNFGRRNFWLQNQYYTMAFKMKPSTLKAIINDKTPQAIIRTNHGNLYLGLDVIGEASIQALKQSPRYWFTIFAEQMAEIKA